MAAQNHQQDQQQQQLHWCRWNVFAAFPCWLSLRRRGQKWLNRLIGIFVLLATAQFMYVPSDLFNYISNLTHTIKGMGFNDLLQVYGEHFGMITSGLRPEEPTQRTSFVNYDLPVPAMTVQHSTTTTSPARAPAAPMSMSSTSSLLDQLESMGDQELLQLALQDPDKYEELLSGLSGLAR